MPPIGKMGMGGKWVANGWARILTERAFQTPPPMPPMPPIGKTRIPNPFLLFTLFLRFAKC